MPWPKHRHKCKPTRKPRPSNTRTASASSCSTRACPTASVCWPQWPPCPQVPQSLSEPENQVRNSTGSHGETTIAGAQLWCAGGHHIHGGLYRKCPASDPAGEAKGGAGAEAGARAWGRKSSETANPTAKSNWQTKIELRQWWRLSAACQNVENGSLWSRDWSHAGKAHPGDRFCAKNQQGHHLLRQTHP